VEWLATEPRNDFGGFLGSSALPLVKRLIHQQMEHMLGSSLESWASVNPAAEKQKSLYKKKNQKTKRSNKQIRKQPKKKKKKIITKSKQLPPSLKLGLTWWTEVIHTQSSQRKRSVSIPQIDPRLHEIP
jgi:hypothetical protein